MSVSPLTCQCLGVPLKNVIGIFDIFIFEHLENQETLNHPYNFRVSSFYKCGNQLCLPSL